MMRHFHDPLNRAKSQAAEIISEITACVLLIPIW